MSASCIFCKIASGEMGEPIYQDDTITAFRDINPQAPVHILIIPNQHIASVSDASAEDETLLGKLLLTAAKIAADEEGANQGYRLVINTGAEAGQTVFHLHVHLLAGRSMVWPPG